MPLYVLYAKDGPDGARKRPDFRPAHLEHWSRLAQEGRLVFAGPMLREAGGEPVGSLIIFDADSMDEARRLAEVDPYQTNGVFAATELRPARQVLPDSGR